MGFHKVAYCDVSTGSRSIDSYAILNGSITFVLTSPLPSEAQAKDPAGKQLLEETAANLEKHDNAVADVAFEGDDVDEVYNEAAKNGGKSVSPPETVQDSCGGVKTATIQTFGKKKHTLISRKNYSGVFLPEYMAAMEAVGPLNTFLSHVILEAVDHCVGNQDWVEMDDICDYYDKVLGFHRFWSVDDKDICTDFSALKSIIMSLSDSACGDYPAESL